jgi:tRNA(fMet)-specific endonuclease VapC
VKYILDTNTLSYFFRGEGAVSERLKAQRPADIGIPAPVLYESRHGALRLSSGARQKALMTALDRAIETMNVVPFDGAAAEAAARIRTQLEGLGIPIGPIDIQIAGIAMGHDATLVTRNVREFARVDKLVLENWYDVVV